MESIILIIVFCFLFYAFFLAPSWYDTQLKNNFIDKADIQLEFKTPEDYPALIYVKDKIVYYYDFSKQIFEQILPQNLLDVKVEKHYVNNDNTLKVNKLEILVVTSKKVYSVNTFGKYVDRDRNKIEMLAGLIKSNIK